MNTAHNTRARLEIVLAIALKFPGDRANVLAKVTRYEIARPSHDSRTVERLEAMGESLRRLHEALV